MSDNLALWKRVSKTDPRAVKPITGKQYSGNSPKPYYIVERLTEEFGPCGKGWGFAVLSERFERFSETDSLHVALVQFWYELEGEKHHFQQMGQTKASYMSGAGKFILDEDAPKKSVTDALVKCASYLGFAGDIFSGRWDDSKYVAELRKEFTEPKAEEPSRPAQVGEPGAITGVKAAALAASGALGNEGYLIGFAEKIKTAFPTSGPKKCANLIAGENFDDTELIFLSTKLPSGINNAIKKAQAEIRNEKEAHV
jgi:hypothetical protein